MDFNLSGQTLSIQCWTNENFGKLGRSAAFDFHENILFDNIGHFLFLLLAFIDFFFEVRDLL